MKKIFASFCLLAFVCLTFGTTPAFSREIIRESVSYNAAPGVNYTTTKVTSTPTRMTTGEKVGTAIAATALIGGIIALAAVTSHDDRPSHHEYRYDSHRGHAYFHHNPPAPAHHSYHYSHNNMHRPPMPRH